MRIKFHGSFRPYGFADAVDTVAQGLVNNGVDEIRQVYLYLTPMADGDTLLFHDEFVGEPLEHLEFSGRSRRRLFKITSPRLRPEET